MKRKTYNNALKAAKLIQLKNNLTKLKRLFQAFPQRIVERFKNNSINFILLFILHACRHVLVIHRINEAR